LDRTLISWNLPNLITVPLMAALGFLLVALVAQVLRQQFGVGQSASQVG